MVSRPRLAKIIAVKPHKPFMRVIRDGRMAMYLSRLLFLGVFILSLKLVLCLLMAYTQ
jgi:hypothetical protein